MNVIFFTTLRQLLRQSNLWLINIFAIVTSEFSPAFAELFTFGNAENAVIESIKASLYLAIIITSILCIYRLLSSELNDKIAINLFAKPISFMDFLLGKYLAMLIVILIVSLFQAIWLVKHAYFLDWSSLGVKLAFTSLFGVFLQGACLIAFSMMLALVFNKGISIILLILSLFISYLVPSDILIVLSAFFPALSFFDFSELIYKKVDFSINFIGLLTLYSIVYIYFCLKLSEFFFKKKEF